VSLAADGADAIDLGAAASNPDARAVPPDEERRRLAPVIAHLKRLGIRVSVDSFQAETQRWALAEGVDFVNDTRGFPDPALYHDLAAGSSRLVVMHSVQTTGRASRTAGDASAIVERVLAFFGHRLAALEAAGVARDRCILDPGMGYFVGAGPESSIAVLRAIGRLEAEFGLPVLVSVSRKSFLGTITGRAVAERGPATLAAELFAVRQGAGWLRTHDVRALRDALAVERALGG
jgi:dihydropteroate synthase type 2